MSRLKSRKANDNICRSSIRVVDKGQNGKSSKSPGPPYPRQYKIATLHVLTVDKDRNVNIPYAFPRQPCDSLMVGPITGMKHSNLVNVSFPSSPFVMLRDVAMS